MLVTELVRLLASGRVESERVLAYLAAAEAAEPDVWLRDDIRLAWVTVLYAAREIPDPWRFAFWMMYGKTPEKAIPIWAERAAEHAAKPPHNLYLTARTEIASPLRKKAA